MRAEREYSVEEISRLTGLDPETIREYIRKGRIKAEYLGSAFDENYRVRESSLLADGEMRELILAVRTGERREVAGEGETEAASLIELVDR